MPAARACPAGRCPPLIVETSRCWSTPNSPQSRPAPLISGIVESSRCSSVSSQIRNDRPRPPGPSADHRMDRPALSQQTTPPRSAAKETSHQTAPASPRHGTRAARARGTSATNGRRPAQATQATAGCQAQAEQPLHTHRNPGHADRRWRGSTVARLSTPRRTRCPQRRQGCVPYRLTWDTGGCRGREFTHG